MQPSRKKSAGLVPSPERSPRIGYVNVNGLDQLKWESCLRLLHMSFDFLFLAETWFVGHAKYVRDRRFVSSTPLPSPSLQRTRNGGGLYLLASASARGRLLDDVKATPSTITFDIDGLSVSGIYLQPSMCFEDVVATLRSVAASTVVMGDVNARLPWLETQSGRPGPPERVEALSDFVRCHAFTAVQPHKSPCAPSSFGLPTKAILAKSLTVDHCFVKMSRVSHARLLLLENVSIGLSTDHIHTLHLQLKISRSASATTDDSSHSSLRFHLSKLSDERVRKDMCNAFDVEVKSRGLMSRSIVDPSCLDRLLVSLAQSICRRFLGQRKSCGLAAGTRRDLPVGRQDPAISTLLYKSAAVESRENGVILPSESGRAKGLSALQEVSASLASRYAGRPSEDSQAARSSNHSFIALSEEDVAREIRRQDANKTCGLDGIHMRVIKALLPSSYPTVLRRLFNLCLSTGSSPSAWNSTEIHMVTKDVNRARDADNVRPITLICMHRKLFERLLLVHSFDSTGWAKLHPTQAGFRGDYSTLTNAAVVHHLLSTATVRYAAFIDLEKAFDMVDHTRLSDLLASRRCPDHVHRLIRSLTFQGLRSRVLVNNQSSGWLPRTRGVLQGSPLSPYLFNIYIDELISELNRDSTGIPQCLFYADDGVLLARDLDILCSLADILTEWSNRAGIAVNVKKCGIVIGRAASFDEAAVPVYISGSTLPVVEVYNYLGFPVKSRGIDFCEYLSKRLSQATGRASFLRLYSDTWGPAHRLRIYSRYLAPMFEYGAPLVFAWACQNEANMKAFYSATKGWKDLVGWILDCSPDGSAVGANLCGVLEPAIRFRHLHTSFQRLLSLGTPESPLSACLASKALLPLGGCGKAFLDGLREAPEWAAIAPEIASSSCSRRLLRLHLRRSRRSVILISCSLRHLSRLTARSRSTTVLLGADCVFLAPLEYQQDFVRYRMGRFQLGKTCVCDPDVMFRRGHEICRYLPQLIQLSGSEKRQKAEMARRLGIDTFASFTDIDFLLNLRQYRRAGRALATIRKTLGDVYSERMAACDDSTQDGAT